ncbi:MAG: precorrin-2 C(20)-methyltransferase [Deltaproteobacteria bacterium]|nr:precorrin-2 C(20)-methyltransferase [Deltaproteobacteria bacterium]
MGTKKGILYGLGVGPGDPELITLKAARVLNSVDLVYAAASTKNSYSLAVSIAKPHIPDLTPVKMLKFPMTSDRKEMEKAWQANALEIIQELEQGKKVAFLTLGDSMIYSTYCYLLRHIQMIAPHLPVISIPGITSYQASAACLNTPLVEGEESLLITSGAKGGDHFRQLSVKPETVVFLKAYRNVKDISDALDEAGLLENSVGVSNCGLPDEEIIRSVRELANRPPDYWTLIIAKQKKENGAFEG